MEFNATIMLRGALTEKVADTLMSGFEHYHPAVGAGRAGTEVVITVHGDTLAQAVTTVLAVCGFAGVDPVGVEVLPTDVWDKRAESLEVPPLVSAAEAAEILGISRQAVAARLEAGTLRGARVGKVWVIPRANLG